MYATYVVAKAMFYFKYVQRIFNNCYHIGDDYIIFYAVYEDCVKDCVAGFRLQRRIVKCNYEVLITILIKSIKIGNA